MPRGTKQQTQPSRPPWWKRWLQNMRCIALEVVRTVCTALQRDTAIADEAMVPIKEALEQRLSNESGLFAFFQHSRGAKTLATTLAARRYLPLSPFVVSHGGAHMSVILGSAALQTWFAGASGSVTTFSLDPTLHRCDTERMGMWLAHTGVLHWRVWAPLYLREGFAIVKLREPELV